MKRIALLAAIAISAGLAGCKSEPAAPKKSPDAVKVEFFVMSQCPFGVQVVDAIKEPLEKLGGDVDFKVNYIGNTSPTGELASMHGPDEVTGDIVQLCAAKYAPANYMNMLACQNKNFREVAKNWESCAAEAKVPADKIRSCLNGQEGKDLLKASFARATEKRASGSPTIFIADKQYSGRRGANDLLRAICAEHKGQTKPAACQSIPEPAKVNVTILSDKRCTDCNADRFANMLKFRLANPDVKMVDYADEAGKKLYEEVKAGSSNLPLILFDATLDADKEGAQMFSRHLKPAGATFRSLEVGGSWNPVCADDNGCTKPECANTLACRKELPGKLEVFVMSQCPYGVRALNAMDEVLKAFDRKLDFSVHYIANGTAAAGFNSLHGQAEVDENIRELCAIKHYGKNFKYMDYILCRNKDIRGTNWESCATGGIDAKVIKACAEGEGKKLHEEDIKVANGLGIGASPTWVANGKYKFSGIDAQTIQRNLCQHNASLKGCEKTLSGPEAGAPVQGGCGK